MTLLKRFFFTLIVGLFSVLSLQAQVVVPGEELVYDVSYMGISLGNIRVTTLKNVDFNGKNVYHTKVYIDSRKGIPFIDLH